MPARLRAVFGFSERGKISSASNCAAATGASVFSASTSRITPL